MNFFSIYSLKFRFGKLLNPIVCYLRKCNVTPNQITLSALILSIFSGIFLMILPSFLWTLPFILFIRMALNAIDGVMARTFQMQTKLGLYLNEFGDILSDFFLSLPFLFCATSLLWVVLFMFLTLLSEIAGLLAPHIGVTRRYDGPLGKSDRAFSLSLFALLLTFRPSSPFLMTVLFQGLSLLLLWTIFNRIYRALGL